ncbi:class I SAM-dependent methyltransferase [Chloroflexota bacterium]
MKKLREFCGPLEKIDGKLKMRIGEFVMAKDAMERDWDIRAKHDAIQYVADKYRGEAFFEEGTKQAYRFCSSFFKKEGFQPEGKRMLDIGCGIGRMERGFSKMFGEVWGLDVSGEMVAQAIELNKAVKNVKFVKGNGQDLDVFPDQYFDFVFSYITFQHIPEKQMVLNYFSEIHRVLKPDGLFKVLLRQQWAGVAFAFGFIPIPRFILPHIPDLMWTVYEQLACRGEKKLYRGKTWRGSGVSENEAKQALLRLQFKVVEIEEDPSKVTFWCYGRK